MRAITGADELRGDASAHAEAANAAFEHMIDIECLGDLANI